MTDDHTIDEFDRLLGAYDGLPGTAMTKPTTIQSVTTLVGDTQTFIVQTLRVTKQDETTEFLVFLQHAPRQKGLTRLVLPATVTNTIMRQRDALITSAGRKTATRVAAERNAAGWKPTPPRRKGAPSTARRKG
jgi:hypothetical protein